jgi:hypothetical protein
MDANEIRTPEGQLVTLTPEGEMIPVVQEETFDQILKARGGMPNREVRTTYSTETQEGKEMMLRHMQAEVAKGTKDSFINKEVNIIGATSWPVQTFKSPDGKELPSPRKLIRTVLETDEGDLIPSSSAYVYESLQMIQSLYGPATPKNPIRVRLGKAGQADKLFSVQVVNSAKRVGDNSKSIKIGK